MRLSLLIGLSALVASSAAHAFEQRAFMPQRPTISNVGVRATSTGTSDVAIRQNSQYNAAAVVVISPRGSVDVQQRGSGANAATVGVVGRSNVNIGQYGGRAGNSAAVTVRSPSPR